MMLFLDAHALLWWWSDDRRLGQPARRSIADEANTVVVSAGTVWEIAVKRQAGRLEAPANILETIEAEEFEILPITGADAVSAAELPRHHGDPFDRLLIAQALRLDAPIVTRDGLFSSYGVRVLPA